MRNGQEVNGVKPDIDEALRYLGAGNGAPETLRREISAMADRLAGQLQPRWTYQVFDLRREDGAFRLCGPDIVLAGRTAERMLAQCGQAVLLACTLGVRFDALLRAEQVRDMARAVMLDACGSALVESGCNAAEGEIRARFPDRYLTDRFSPGYGDLPLTLQPSICAALDMPRRLGVHVTGSLLMNPAKSVTAVIGLSDRPQRARIRGCAYCSMRETCTLRKGGKSCAL